MEREVGDRMHLTLREFVRHFGLSESTVRRRVRDGSLSAVQVGGKGKKILLRVDALERTNNTTANAAVCPAAAPVDALEQTNSTTASARIEDQSEQTPLTPSTGTPTEPRPGPRPRWTRRLPRRPK